MSTITTTSTTPYIDDGTFHADVEYIESLWQRKAIGATDMPLIDIGNGAPLVFVPILEQLEFVYARQVRALSQSRRVIMYRRHETRTQAVSLAERAEELREVLDYLDLEAVDFVAHGDAAMVLFEFAVRYPQRCRSLVIIAQGADYDIAPHPFIWLLHELFVRLPIEHFLPAWFLRRLVINYIMVSQKTGAGATQGSPPFSTPPPPLRGGFLAETEKRRARGQGTRATQGSPPSSTPPPPLRDTGVPAPERPSLPRHLVEEQFCKIQLWPFVYKFSVLPVIHYFDMRNRLDALTMPILLINRYDDALAPEPKTHWLSEQLPNCAGYHLVAGGERFFMYSQAEAVTPLIERFLAREDARL